MESQQKSPVNTKQMYIIGGILAVVIIAIVAFVVFGRNGETANPTQTASPTPEGQEVIPTVDSSVKVEVEGNPDGKHFSMTVENMPKGTTAMEYEITYQTEDGGLPGISSSIDIESGKDSYEKDDFLLGTCSTGGKCIYHEVVGPLNVVIKFIGSYGERLFQKEFEL